MAIEETPAETWDNRKLTHCRRRNPYGPRLAFAILIAPDNLIREGIFAS
jgi:hypothetical protein